MKKPDQLYRIHVGGTPITKPMNLKDIESKHGPVRELEKDPYTKVVPHQPKPKAVKKDSFDVFKNLDKAVKTPSKHLSRDFLRNTLKDNNISYAQGGKKQTEYHQEEMEDLLHQKDREHADKWADDMWDKWIQEQVDTKKSELSKEEKGVHQPHIGEGISEAGAEARIHAANPVSNWVNKKRAQKIHQQKLAELKSMPKPDLPKSELQKSKNVREQRQKVWGTNPTPSVNSPLRQKMMDHIVRFAQQRYNMPVERAPGKLNASGKMIDKPQLSQRSIQHIGNPASLLHELAHIEAMKQSGMPPDEFQSWMDKRWGQINQELGYKQQARETEEYASHGAETKMRRQLGLPIHTRETKEKNPKRLFAADNPAKQIAVDTPQGKRITGLSSNLEPRQKEFEARQRGEEEYSPTQGWVPSDKPDAIINRRAAGDKTGAALLLWNKLQQRRAKKNG